MKTSLYVEAKKVVFFILPMLALEKKRTEQE